MAFGQASEPSSRSASRYRGDGHRRRRAAWAPCRSVSAECAAAHPHTALRSRLMTATARNCASASMKRRGTGNKGSFVANPRRAGQVGELRAGKLVDHADRRARFCRGYGRSSRSFSAMWLPWWLFRRRAPSRPRRCGDDDASARRLSRRTSFPETGKAAPLARRRSCVRWFA